MAVMSHSDLSEKNIKLSDDVKDTIALARDVAKKEKTAQVSDFQILQALVMNSRRFSKLDALLKAMKVSPKRLSGKIRAASSQHADEASGTLPSSKTLPPLVEAARQSVLAENGKSRGLVDVEHLLKALTQSGDTAVSTLMAEEGITADRIDEVVPKVESRNLPRSVMFLLREVAEVVVVVLFFLVVIKEGFGELRLIPSESMVPLLQVEDRILIEKVSRWFRPYQRGDVLVFYPPMTQLKNDPVSIFLRLTGFSGLIYQKEDNIDIAYIKRLIGLPGDTLEVKPGEGVYINGKKLNEPYVNEIAQTCTRVEPVEVCGPITIPEGKYFFMGDNRNQSLDSRFWGFEPKDRVIGRAVLRVWPINRFGVLPEPHYDASKPTP